MDWKLTKSVVEVDDAGIFFTNAVCHCAVRQLAVDRRCSRGTVVRSDDSSPLPQYLM